MSLRSVSVSGKHRKENEGRPKVGFQPIMVRSTAWRSASPPPKRDPDLFVTLREIPARWPDQTFRVLYRSCVAFWLVPSAMGFMIQLVRFGWPT